MGFCDLGEIDPVHVDRAYWLAPERSGLRPYALLVRALERTGHAGLGRFVLSGKEHLSLVRPTGGILCLQTLFWPQDLRRADHERLRALVAEATVTEAELALAVQLVAGLRVPFEPDALRDVARERLLAYLERRAAAETPAATPEDQPEPPPDLLAALRSSLEAFGAPGDAGPPEHPGRERRRARG
jgi:DNA end-binding protein Ku